MGDFSYIFDGIISFFFNFQITFSICLFYRYLLLFQGFSEPASRNRCTPATSQGPDNSNPATALPWPRHWSGIIDSGDLNIRHTIIGNIWLLHYLPFAYRTAVSKENSDLIENYDALDHDSPPGYQFWGLSFVITLMRYCPNYYLKCRPAIKGRHQWRLW